AHRVSAHVHSVGIHLSDCQHADRAAVHHRGRAGSVLSDCAAGRRAERADAHGPLALAPRARDLRGGRAGAGLREAGTPMRGRIATLIRKEFLELRQSPRLIGLIVVAPILQLTMLGYAATTDVSHVPIVGVDGDRTPRSRQLLQKFSASPYFTIVDER